MRAPGRRAPCGATAALLAGALALAACGGDASAPPTPGPSAPSTSKGAGGAPRPLTAAEQTVLDRAAQAQQDGLFELVHGLLGEALLAERPIQPEVQFVAGYAAFELGAWGEADTRLSAAVAARPALLPASSALGFARHKLGDYDGAQEAFAAIVAADPGKHKAHYGLGLVALSQGRTEAAGEHLREALALQPEYLKARFARARLLDAEGQLDEALAEVEWVLARWPSHEEALYLLAQLLAALDRPEDAEEALTQRAVVYATKESIGELRTAVREGRDDPLVRLRIAEAYRSLGDEREARRALAAGLKRFPGHPVLERAAGIGPDG